MNILIVTATAFEAAPLAEAMELVPGTSADGKLKQYIYGRHEVHILCTGIGMTATAFYLGKTLGDLYDLVINMGLAGSFNKNLDIGTVVNVYSDRFSELGAEDGDNFLTLAELNLPDDNAILFIDGELVNNTVIENKVIEELPKVNGITVNKVHGNEQSIATTYDRFHPMVESMEGAAFLYCCKAEGIPCLQLRAVSNFVERRNKSNWNIPLAITNLNNKALEILNSIA
jgi:futalosine hydrolase